MQFQGIIEYLYNYFPLLIWIAFGCIIFVLAFTSWIIRAQIGTKVMIIRNNTGEMKRFKEPIGKGYVEWNKTKYKINGQPVFCHSLLRPYRFYLHQEGSEEVISPNLYIYKTTPKKKDEKGNEIIDEQLEESDTISNAAFQDILENDVISQSIKGLVGSLMERLVYLAAGGFLGIVLWEILQGVFAK